MSVASVTTNHLALNELAHEESVIELETPREFEPVFTHLAINKIDEVVTRIVYTVDWEGKKQTTINVIAVISRTHARIIGYMPVAGVALGACRMSLGFLKLGLAAASLGACKMFGLPMTSTLGEVVQNVNSIKQGFIQVLPLAVGAATYLSNYTPSVDLLVSGLKVSEDKWGVVTDFCETTTKAAFKEDEDRYQEYKPWAKTVLHACEKTYTFASDGAECLVTCAAWGDIALGVGALIASPYTGGTSLPYALVSIARGALSLGASTLIDMANEYDLKGKIVSYFSSGEEKYDPEFEIYRLTYLNYHECHKFAEAYEAMEALGLSSSEKKSS